MNFKEASAKACEIWVKLRLYKDMATFQTLQTWIGHKDMIKTVGRNVDILYIL